MKSILISLAIVLLKDVIVDAIIAIVDDLSQKTDNTIDNKVAEALKANKDLIKAALSKKK